MTNSNAAPISSYYWAFDGVTGVTAGQPNETTGRYNCHGGLVAFNTEAERDSFCTEYNPLYNTYPTPCDTHTARKFCLGMSVSDYVDALHHIVSTME